MPILSQASKRNIRALQDDRDLFKLVADELGATGCARVLHKLYVDASGHDVSADMYLEGFDFLKSQGESALCVLEDVIREARNQAADELMDGWIYILANRSMPGIFKIGMTQRNPAIRAKELGIGSGIPTPFDVVFECMVAQVAEVERRVHLALKPYRVSEKREFFRIEPEDAVSQISRSAALVWEDLIGSEAVSRGKAYLDWECEGELFLTHTLPKKRATEGDVYLWQPRAKRGAPYVIA